MECQGILKEKLEQLINDMDSLYEEGKLYEAREPMFEAWDLLPGDKYICAESYWIVAWILDLSLEIHDMGTANEWVGKIFKCDLTRGDYGDREMYAGKVAYESGDLAEAKKFFEIAYKKSGERCFVDEADKKYLPQNIEKIKEEEGAELEDKVYDRICTLSQEGDLCFEKDHFESAKKKYREALDLIPEPKYDWEASTWLYTAMGEVDFCCGNYSQALDLFNEAIKCPDGVGNSLINLRIGECYYELALPELAKEYLLRAYMLEGEEIFDGEDKKYLSALRKEGIV